MTWNTNMDKNLTVIGCWWQCQPILCSAAQDNTSLVFVMSSVQK